MRVVILSPGVSIPHFHGNQLVETKLLSNIAHMAFCITNSEGRFHEANQAFIELFGYAREELIGQPFTMVVDEKDGPSLQTLHDLFIAGEDKMPTEWTVFQKDGTEMRVASNAVRMLNGNGVSMLTIVERL